MSFSSKTRGSMPRNRESAAERLPIEWSEVIRSAPKHTSSSLRGTLGRASNRGIEHRRFDRDAIHARRVVLHVEIPPLQRQPLIPQQRLEIFAETSFRAQRL